MHLKLLTVVGARPQFVKAAVASRAIAERNQDDDVSIVEELVHTGQHYDYGMSRVFFEEMEIPEPVENLGVGSGTHGATTGRMLGGLEFEIEQRRPDVVLTYGDTNSTLAAALAAAKLHVPVAHVEAGLRSFNRQMPEEINRVLTDHVSDQLFCPSETAQEQLAREGIERGVHVVGDVMVDAVRHYKKRRILPQIDEPFALATVHRAENTDDPMRLRDILDALAECPISVVLPLHPRTEAAIRREQLAAVGSLKYVKPVTYLAMLGLLDTAEFVFTDSGGLQKEAFLFNKRCVTLREETEWTELVDIDANRVVGADRDEIKSAIAWAREPLVDAPPIYGDGMAGQRIVTALLAAYAR